MNISSIALTSLISVTVTYCTMIIAGYHRTTDWKALVRRKDKLEQEVLNLIEENQRLCAEVTDAVRYAEAITLKLNTLRDNAEASVGPLKRQLAQEIRENNDMRQQLADLGTNLRPSVRFDTYAAADQAGT